MGNIEQASKKRDKAWAEWIEEQDRQVPGYISPEQADRCRGATMRIPWEVWKAKRKHILGYSVF